MCGITGLIDFTNRSSEVILQKMSDTLAHRGPDGEGILLDIRPNYTVGLGHRRLSIIDLSAAGKQPMIHEHLTITYNGEVYNFIELKEELIRLGHHFKSNCDTEIILQAYEEWGKECLSKFIGMFAFVIYDKTKNEIFCARDRAGIKPFYYYWHKDLFLFSSELKAFHQHLDFSKSINLHSAAAFMQFGNVPTPHCIFNYCYKLEPGHSLLLSLDNKQIEISEYWNVYDSYNAPKLDISLKEAEENTLSVLKSAFNYRMVADVPVGVFLSGGYDSTCLTAILQSERTEKIKTFTIGVPDIGLNEAEYAKKVAQQLGTDHSEFTCTENEILNLISEIPYHYDEPFGDSSAIPTTLVSKMARESVTVVLSADGGDEVFAGYNRYDYLVKYGTMLNSVPAFLRKSSYNLMSAVNADSIPFLNNTYNFHNRYEKLKLLLRDPSPKNMMLSLSKQYDEKHAKELFKKDIFPLNTEYQSNELLEDFYSPLCYMLAIDYKTYLPDDILQKVDRASMSASLEAREPFLDHRIIELAARLPDNYKYNKGIKKFILKEIVHKYIPKEMMDRPKMGFAIPIENWLATTLREKVDYYLSKELILKQGIFEISVIEKLKTQFFAGKKELGQKIWYLLMFQMWHEKWMK